MRGHQFHQESQSERFLRGPSAVKGRFGDASPGRHVLQPEAGITFFDQEVASGVEDRPIGYLASWSAPPLGGGLAPIEGLKSDQNVILYGPYRI